MIGGIRAYQTSALCGWIGVTLFSLSLSLSAHQASLYAMHAHHNKHCTLTTYAEAKLREREREVLHLSSHTRLIQVLPGQPLQVPKDETVCINTKKDKPMNQ